MYARIHNFKSEMLLVTFIYYEVCSLFFVHQHQEKETCLKHCKKSNPSNSLVKCVLYHRHTSPRRGQLCRNAFLPASVMFLQPYRLTEVSAGHLWASSTTLAFVIFQQQRRSMDESCAHSRTISMTLASVILSESHAFLFGDHVVRKGL